MVNFDSTIPLDPAQSYFRSMNLADLSPDDAEEFLDMYDVTAEEFALVFLAAQGETVAAFSPRLQVFIKHGKLGTVGKIIFDVMNGTLAQLATGCVSAGNA